MAHYFVSRYTHVVPLPNGKLALRVSCPTCGFLHAGLGNGGESVCSGCHQMLRVRGDELLTSVSASRPTAEAEEECEAPDHPGARYEERD